MKSVSKLSIALATGALVSPTLAQCPDYTDYSTEYHAPGSGGVYDLPFQRPDPACRTFVSTAVEDTITSMNATIADPDLFRLFENGFPNTLDTAIKWKGYAANNSAEELTFVITGDINAMWLRDSANQMQSYLSVLTPSTSNDSIASLYRGVINLQTRYLLTSPYCNAFQPPVESGLDPAVNSYGATDEVTPPYTNDTVFECKYELDSLAAFLEISTDYYNATGDLNFFGAFQWIDAVEQVLDVADGLMVGTYAENGTVNELPYTWERTTTSGTETLSNLGRGNPVNAGTGLIRSAFRPSDDATIYQLFIPANMMFASYLETTAVIMSGLDTRPDLVTRMQSLSSSIRAGIETYGIVDDPVHGQIYAYEIDGYGGRNVMDDANIPSLLAAPVYGYLDANDEIYQNTRNVVLSSGNPYFMRGPVINAVGGPHDSFGYAWPMASIVRILTSSNDTEIISTLKEILSSTDDLGLIHESINTFNQSDYTRQWFSWANGLFGQMILDLNTRKPYLLSNTTYQS